MSDFIFWGSKITADGDGSQEIKRCLLLGRKVMTTVDSILKSRDIINNLTLHLKQLEKEEMKNPRVSRRKEILKIRAGINAKET